MLSLAINTHAFPTGPEGDLEFCNGRPGSALADWLRESLSQHGVAVRDSLQEDYGWGFWLDHETAIWVAIGLVDGEDESSGEPAMPSWIVSVTHEAPIFSPRQWFRRSEGRKLARRTFDIIESAILERGDMILEK